MRRFFDWCNENHRLMDAIWKDNCKYLFAFTDLQGLMKYLGPHKYALVYQWNWKPVFGFKYFGGLGWYLGLGFIWFAKGTVHRVRSEKSRYK